MTLFGHLNDIWWWAKPRGSSSLSLPLYSSLLAPSLNTLFPNTFSLYSFLSLRDQVLRPCETNLYLHCLFYFLFSFIPFLSPTVGSSASRPVPYFLYCRTDAVGCFNTVSIDAVKNERGSERNRRMKQNKVSLSYLSLWLTPCIHNLWSKLL